MLLFKSKVRNVINDESYVAWWSVSVWQAASCHVIVAVDTSPVRTNIVHGATSFLPSSLPSIPLFEVGEDKLRHKKHAQFVKRVSCHLLGCVRLPFYWSRCLELCMSGREMRCVLV